MRKEIHLKTYRILLYIFAFVIPFSTPSLMHSQGRHFYFNITPMLLGLFLLNWLLEADFKAKFRQVRENKLTFPFFAAIGFYGIYLIGLIYSTNMELGKADILLKIPFLLFPLLIFTIDAKMWNPKMAQNLLYTFVLGNLSTLLISLVHSFLRCDEIFSITYFHYMNASLFFHPSYASMYYCFAFVIVLYFLINKKLCLWKKITAWFMFLLFPSEIVLLDSRTGQLAFVAVMIVFACYIFVYNRKQRLRFVFYMSLLATTLVTTYLLLPQNTNRLIANIYQMNVENIKRDQLNEDVQAGLVNARIQIWVSAVEVIKENPVFGVGTGDVKDALMEKYIQNDFYMSQERRYNAHNQFLQVAVTLGFVGLTLFFVFFGWIFWMGWKKRNILLLSFGVIGIVNFCTESMLERQVGVMFFAFFFALLSYIAAFGLLKDNQE